MHFITTICLGGFIVLSVYHFLIYCGRRKDLSNLFYTIYCLSMVASIYVKTIYQSGPSYNIMVYLSLVVLVYNMTWGAITFLYHNLFEVDKKRGYKKLLYLYLLLALISVIMIILSLTSNNIAIVALYFIALTIYVGLFLFYNIYLFFKERQYGNKVKLIFFINFIFAVLIIAFFALKRFTILRTVYSDLFYPLMLINAVIFAYGIASKFNLEHKELETTAEELQLERERYRELNDSLEEKVSEQIGEIREANERLEKEEREKTSFYTHLMHHLKTPVSTIRGLLESDEFRGNHKLMTALVNARELSSSLLNYLTVEAAVNRGESGYEHSLVSNISKIAEQVALCFGGHKIESEIEPELKVKIDSNGFSRLLTCLLDNAIKHNSSAVEIELSLKREGQWALLTVSDNGSGIDSELVSHIFKPFYQLANKRSNSQGIGMGLNFVKVMVDSVGGEIEFDNRVGGGISFKLKFPLTSGEAPAETGELLILNSNLHDEQDEVGDSDYCKERHNILIVEDNRALLFTLKELFKEYNVFTARNGREGLERLRSLTAERIYISLILSDEMMDEMSGFEFIQAVREVDSFKAIPFVFLTARTGFEDLLRGLRYKAVDYIRKPFISLELKLRIASHIEQKEAALNDYFDDESRQGDERILSFCRKKGLTEQQSYFILQTDLGIKPREIALKYGQIEKALNYKTVETQIRRSYKKFGVEKREQLVELLTEVRKGAAS